MRSMTGAHLHVFRRTTAAIVRPQQYGILVQQYGQASSNQGELWNEQRSMCLVAHSICVGSSSLAPYLAALLIMTQLASNMPYIFTILDCKCALSTGWKSLLHVSGASSFRNADPAGGSSGGCQSVRTAGQSKCAGCRASAAGTAAPGLERQGRERQQPWEGGRGSGTVSAATACCVCRCFVSDLVKLLQLLHGRERCETGSMGYGFISEALPLSVTIIFVCAHVLYSRL